MRTSLFILILCTCCGCNGLFRSRYAMDDPKYAEKYEEGADQWDVWGKAKQALDARHTAGLGGIYIGGGAQMRPESSQVVGGGEIGTEGYVTNWLTGRASLGIYGAEREGYGGVDLGVRVQAPTRIAPFAGVGTFQGVSRTVKSGAFNGLDDNDDGFIDEFGEEYSSYDGWLSTIYPEVGAHLWLNGSVRITAYGRYFMTTLGRDQDTWVVGGQINVFSRPGS